MEGIYGELRLTLLLKRAMLALHSQSDHTKIGHSSLYEKSE